MSFPSIHHIFRENEHAIFAAKSNSFVSSNCQNKSGSISGSFPSSGPFFSRIKKRKLDEDLRRRLCLLGIRFPILVRMYVVLLEKQKSTDDVIWRLRQTGGDKKKVVKKERDFEKRGRGVEIRFLEVKNQKSLLSEK